MAILITDTFQPSGSGYYLVDLADVEEAEVPVEITVPLADPLVASADTTLTPRYTYKDPWVAGAQRRIGAWWAEFESNVGGDVTL